MKVKILEIKESNIPFVRDQILIEADDNCKRIFDSYFGERRFYLKKGERIWVKVKRNPFIKGEKVDFKKICTSSTAWQFSWEWLD